MSAKLEGKTVLVTGSSRGMGKVIAEQFLNQGCNMVITSRNADELNQAENDIGKTNGKILKVAADITSPGDVIRLIDNTITEFGQIDIVINNAGVFKMGPADQTSIEDFRLSLDINLTGSFLICKYVLPHMKKRKKGQIINICSIWAQMGLENLSAYCASKAGLAMFGDCLKAELKPYRIRVTNLFPHSINSQKQDIDPGSDKRLQMIEPEDIAEALINIASAAEHVQYQDVTVYPISTKITKTENME